jgi:hypothetical protein
MTVHRRTRRRARRGLYLLAFSVLVFVIADLGLGILDQRIRTSPHPGYVAESTWTWYLPSAAAWYEGLAEASGSEDLGDALVPRFNDLCARLEQATGQAVDIQTWQAYFGEALLIGGRDDDWFVCLRPGLQGRLFLAIQGLRKRWGGGEVFPAHAWRDGFLIAGTPGAVEALKTAPMLSSIVGRDLLSRATGPRALAVLNRDLRGRGVRMLIEAKKQFPLELYVPVGGTLVPGELMAYTAPDWPPLAVTLADEFEAGLTQLYVLRGLLPTHDAEIKAVSKLLNSESRAQQSPAFPQPLGTGVPLQVTRVLGAAPRVEGVQVPSWGEIRRYDNTVPPQSSAEPPVFPMTWNGAEGWSRPIYGPLKAHNLATREDTLFLASTEPLMAELTRWRPAGARPAVALITLNGRKLAPILERLADTVSSEHDQDLEAWQTVIRVLPHLGPVHLTASQKKLDDFRYELHLTGHGEFAMWNQP